MNLHVLLPVVSQMVGRDVAPDVDTFYRARAAVGAALSPEGQNFVIQNWRKLATFMESAEGQAAIVAFTQEWLKSEVPKEVAAPAPS